MQLRALYWLLLQVYYCVSFFSIVFNCILDDACKWFLVGWAWNKLIFVCLSLSIIGSILFNSRFPRIFCLFCGNHLHHTYKIDVKKIKFSFEIQYAFSLVSLHHNLISLELELFISTLCLLSLFWVIRKLIYSCSFCMMLLVVLQIVRLKKSEKYHFRAYCYCFFLI